MLSLFESFKPISEVIHDKIINNINLQLNKENLLIFDDNLNSLRVLAQKKDIAGKVDLVYIDPPFGTNNIFRLGSTMSSSFDSKIAYIDKFDLNSYLEFLYYRLILIKEIMSSNGSIYLHIDYKMGHYVKILLDEIFGRENFINDITRIKCNPKNFFQKKYGNIKDMVLFYTKASSFIWNEVYEKSDNDNMTKKFPKIDSIGRYTTIPLHAPGETLHGETGREWNGIKPPNGRHWRCSIQELNKLEALNLIEWSKNGVPRKKVYAKDFKGSKIQDIWEFKDPQKPIYPTEKNRDFLKRIILSSSNANSLVMDCFCGSGSFLEEAYKLERKFIGIDNSKEAIEVNKKWINSLNCQCEIIL